MVIKISSIQQVIYHFLLVVCFCSNNDTGTISKTLPHLQCTCLAVTLRSTWFSKRYLKLQASCAFRFMCKDIVYNTWHIHCFWDTARYWSKIADCNLPHLYLTLPLGVIPLECRRDIWRQKTIKSWAIVWRCLRDPRFSHLSKSPTCDRQRDRYTMTASTALA